MGQRFVVPQFIEEENKIFGPVTVRQFIISMIVVVTEVIIFGIAGVSAFFLATMIFFGIPGLVIAFVKVNGQPFHTFLLNIIQSTFKKPQLRVWNKDVSIDELKLEIEKNRLASKVKIKSKIKKDKLTSSRLAELSLIVDTGGMYKGD
ncbi:MAG: PrgI family protein [Patescibacteria group bacterium]